MRSFIIAAALALSVSAFPATAARDVSVANSLVARTPQFGPFKGRGGSDDDDDDDVPSWLSTLPKSSPKSVPRPAGPSPPKNVVPKPKSSLPPPRQLPSPKGKPDGDDEDDEESEPTPKFSAGPKSVPFPKAQGSGNAPFLPAPPKGDRPFPKAQGSGSAPFLPAPPKGDRPFPKAQGSGSAPFLPAPPKGDRPLPKGVAPVGPPKTFTPPTTQQPKSTAVNVAPFPDEKDDDYSVKALNRVRREPNPWMQ